MLVSWPTLERYAAPAPATADSAAAALRTGLETAKRKLLDKKDAALREAAVPAARPATVPAGPKKEPMIIAPAVIGSEIAEAAWSPRPENTGAPPSSKIPGSCSIWVATRLTASSVSLSKLDNFSRCCNAEKTFPGVSDVPRPPHLYSVKTSSTTS